jgi:hypothetical protein
MTRTCGCTKYKGCGPCPHDAVRYATALDTIVNGECYSLDAALAIARAALDGER